MAGNTSMVTAACSLLVVVLVTTSAVPTARAQTGLLPLLGVIRISGNVSCAVNSTAVTSATPAFPNATVQVQCGNDVLASSSTNGLGAFSILLDPLTAGLSSLLSSCKLVVTSPLSTCNASLPSTGLLQSVLSLLSSTAQGVLSIFNLVPKGFNLVVQ